MQQFRADFHIDLCTEFLIVTRILMACGHLQLVLPNRTTLQLPAKRV